MKKFVVIGGAPRSGTNLVRRIIGSHSRIAIPPGEFQFFTRLSRGRTVEQVLERERLKKWDIDFTPYVERDPGEVFVRVLETYTQQAGKEIPGEKTPFNEFFYGEIKEALKGYELKFVHVVRNPLDVMASYKHMRSLRQEENYDLNDIAVHTRNWQRSLMLGLARAHQEPEHYYLLRYEDLASRPVENTRKLCNFLDVDFEEERMLQLCDSSTRKDNTSFVDSSGTEHETYQSIKAPVSRKSYLNSSEVRRICDVCGEAARAYGYDDPDFVCLPPEPEGAGVYAKMVDFTRTHLLRKRTQRCSYGQRSHPVSR